jgi:membrane protein YqaA with SNARE-associated domain
MEFWNVTRENALAHFRAVTMFYPAEAANWEGNIEGYFLEYVRTLRSRIAREKAMDQESEEFEKILGNFRSAEAYFAWLKGVLAIHLAYLVAMEHGD